MPGLRFAHRNSCPHCPMIGAEDIPGEEFFEFRALRFSLQAACELVKPSMLHRVDHAGLASWLEHVFYQSSSRRSSSAEPGPGTEFLVYLLPDPETLELLRRSMGRTVADVYWQRMSDFQPQHNDVLQGNQR